MSEHEINIVSIVLQTSKLTNDLWLGVRTKANLSLTAAIGVTHSIRLLTTIGSVAFIQIALELHVWAVMHYTGPAQPAACG